MDSHDLRSNASQSLDRSRELIQRSVERLHDSIARVDRCIEALKGWTPAGRKAQPQRR